ncbi:MAG: hypothetical protein NC822_03445 [Candidatus Omnitrophica bacterium]|nr:hypothetical protein [Candidatus Omnitrophota bacterium]MCM8827116.1 hypothetical protein [Candidatus Omnitrophota bacterium]
MRNLVIIVFIFFCGYFYGTHRDYIDTLIKEKFPIVKKIGQDTFIKVKSYIQMITERFKKWKSKDKSLLTTYQS